MAAAEGSQLAVAKTNKREITQVDVQSTLDQKVLDTPRTHEACKRLGLMIEDLQIRSYDSFFIPGDLKGKQKMRFEHYEKKRKERYSQVLAERAKVITQNAKKGEVPGVQSAQFLGMLESLFEKEAKRLEIDLKGQLRQHSSLAKENDEQLRKEGQLQERLILQEQRRMRAQQQFEDASQRTKERAEHKHSTNQALVQKLENDFKVKQEQWNKDIAAQEERLMRFQDAKAQENSDKAMVFKEKVDSMKKKIDQLQVQRRIDGEDRLIKIGQKIAQVEARRSEEQENRMMLSEEQHLHLMDVRENKARRERVEQHDREELREQIDSNAERIETLLALKDQLLDQRRARNSKAEATKGSRGLNLRRDCLPGPGQYEAPQSTLYDVPGAKIGQAKVPGMVDHAIKGTIANPAPGSYDSAMLANGDRVDKAANGGKFGDQEKTSYLDDAQKAKEYIPAPGRYMSQAQLDKRGPKMARPRIDDAKGHGGAFTVKDSSPGPAAYSVDDYSRKEVLRRAQRSLPNLTRDMLKPGKLNVRT